MVLRLLVVAAIVGLVLVLNRLYQARRHRILNDRDPHPRLPTHLVAESERTWVVFTTPWCATCGPVSDRLQAHDPEVRVVKVDATAEPSLADAFRIKTAPTVLLADRAGEVLARLVGAESVADYVRSPA